jgi:hypothetical protein
MWWIPKIHLFLRGPLTYIEIHMPDYQQSRESERKRNTSARITDNTNNNRKRRSSDSRPHLPH